VLERPLVEAAQATQAAGDDMRAHPAFAQLPGGPLLHVGGPRPLPVLAGLLEPVAPQAQVGVIGVAGGRAVALGVAQVREELLAGRVENLGVETHGDPPPAPRHPAAARAGF